MHFHRACSLDDLWEGEMTEVQVAGRPVLLVWATGADPRAFQAVCPHQDIPLRKGKLEAHVLMCRAHQWTFDATSGKGINPGSCRLAEYPVKIEDDTVYVSVEGVEALYAHT
jgi:toluene monooxygenase system ferredoxin subunit